MKLELKLSEHCKHSRNFPFGNNYGLRTYNIYYRIINTDGEDMIRPGPEQKRESLKRT